MLKKEKTMMNMFEQQKEIKRLSLRLRELVDELRQTQNDLKQFKEAVARDIKRTIEMSQQAAKK
tara:strand:+ start:930 stop:1121 length:192 start_codon:yes stop_codon:yes gene_type:complete